jgi:hypothetical protein
MKIIGVKLISSFAIAATGSASATDLQGAQSSWSVEKIFDGPNGAPVVMVVIPDDSRVEPGLILKSFRTASRRGGNDSVAEKLSPETGLLKVSEVGEGYALAEVLAEGSALSRAFFPRFPGIMAGDHVVVKPQSVAQRTVVVPETTIPYFQVFADPKANPSGYELSPDGINAIRIAAQAFADKRSNMLIVEGHTDQHGSSTANQVESYQRALTVRQLLVDELGFDPKRVVAIGFGESELLDDSMVDGAIERNRRIVLKISAN